MFRSDAEAQRVAACCELVSEVAGRSGEVRLKLNGTSMLPAMWPGDMVVVQRCALAELRPGQIALCRSEGTVTVHRIKRVFRDHLIMRGDSLPCFDPPVNESGLVGQVVSIFRDDRPISPEQSSWHRVVSWILRRSDFCKRVTVHLGSRSWSQWMYRYQWVKSPIVRVQS